MRKYERTIRELAEQEGWTFKGTTGGNHYRFEKPNFPPYFTSNTPSRGRVEGNFRTYLRAHERKHLCRKTR